jgi:hypothetical protein
MTETCVLLSGGDKYIYMYTNAFMQEKLKKISRAGQAGATASYTAREQPATIAVLPLQGRHISSCRIFFFFFLLFLYFPAGRKKVVVITGL